MSQDLPDETHCVWYEPGITAWRRESLHASRHRHWRTQSGVLPTLDQERTFVEMEVEASKRVRMSVDVFKAAIADFLDESFSDAQLVQLLTSELERKHWAQRKGCFVFRFKEKAKKLSLNVVSSQDPRRR